MIKNLFFLFMLQCQLWAISIPEHTSGKIYDLAICAIFQDEAPYMKEWIEFHKVVGVQHFYLYNNKSTDNYLEVLQPYIENNEVELINWNYDFLTLAEWRILQPRAYENALNLARGKAKWLAIIDLDEYLFPVKEKSLVTFLKEYTQYGGVLVNWQCYGTSHVPFIPENSLMMEKLIMKADADFTPNREYKSIVQPDFVKGCSSAHYCDYKKGYFHVNPNKAKVTKASEVHIDKIRINHYWSRDEHYFFDIKVPREVKRHGSVNGAFWIDFEKKLNDVEDTSIFRFVPALRKQMNFK